VQRAVLEADRAAAPEPVARALDLVLVQIQEHRSEAQKRIRTAARRHTASERLRRNRRKLLETLQPPCTAPEARLADAAADDVPALVEALRRAAAADLNDFATLHAMRIQGKRLRYALEVFAPCFGEGFRDAYAEVEALQEALGAINDCHDLVERIEAWAAEASGDAAAAGREAVEHYRRRRDGLVASFLESWRARGRARLFAALERLVPAADVAPSSGNGEPR
jgi:CHAD domain-containing protein